MTRWTVLAIAFAITACKEGESGRLSRDTSDAAAGAADTAMRTDRVATDSALQTDRGAVRTGASATMESGGAMATDTASTAAARSKGPSGAEAMGGIRTPTTRLDLSAEQVRRLQAALISAGCNAGEVDGVVGRRTRQAIACGLDKNKLRRDDLSGLYRSLGLDF